jgi:putative hydrolase of the HAD superfamily
VNLLVDYAEVISHPQTEDAIAGLAASADLPADVFLQRYWEHRPAYDTGGSAREYWSTVLGRSIAPGQLDELVRRDIDSWTHLNDETLDVLREAHRRGDRMTLLSNAPHELADAVEALPALSFFDALVFSARIGVAKPEPAAFQAALDVMALAAADVVFVDDREVNVTAARDVGLTARLYTSAEELRAALLA